MIVDPNQLLAQAHARMLSGQLDAASADLRRLLLHFPKAASALHLLGLVDKRRGDLDGARRNLEAAVRENPLDPQAHNNFANVLDDLGETSLALTHYRKAIEIAPAFADALINLGLVSQRLGDYVTALDALERACRLQPDQAKPLVSLGVLLREIGRLDEAADALDHALVLAPDHVRALRARAQIECDRGRPDIALSWFSRAESCAPGDPAVAVDQANAQHSLGDNIAALATLETLVQARPDYIPGQTALAQLRWQLNDKANFTHGYETALSVRPRDTALWVAYLSTLMRASYFADVVAVVARARAAAGPTPQFDLAEAAATSEMGEIDRANQLFEALDNGHPTDTSVGLAYIRHLLRARRPDRAAIRSEQLLNVAQKNQLAWAYLGTAWQQLGDERHSWLFGETSFVAVQDLKLNEECLDRLAERLRSLHQTQTHPYDQTLRGGTQTNGTLFLRTDPEIAELRQAIELALDSYIGDLPAIEPAHPLLGRPRSTRRFSGSWSVRLQGQGFHVNHVHPQGWISSAFYVAIPSSCSDSGSSAGWLALGEPPLELGLDLQPTQMVKPAAGRLVLFPSYLWHGTRPFSDGERLTVAFDVQATSATASAAA